MNHVPVVEEAAVVPVVVELVDMVPDPDDDDPVVNECIIGSAVAPVADGRGHHLRYCYLPLMQ